jgi:ferritin-like metal-binding protein YciE
MIPADKRTEEGRMQAQTLTDLFVYQLEDLYSTEQQLVQSLPKMAAAASDEKLRQALEHHLRETHEHVRRLDDVIAGMGLATPARRSAAAEGLLREGQLALEAQGDPSVRDAALIAAAQRIEHYEIAGYGTARTLADQLDLDDAEDLLGQTLDEESDADKLLTKIATGGMFKTGVNERAAR